MTSAPRPDHDIIRRGIKRTLPCLLTDEEALMISRQRVDKEALRDALVEDFDRIKAKHRVALEELDDEILKARNELRANAQDRTVLCHDAFERAADDTGWVVTIRLDTGAVAERRPATPAETQRYLPGIEGVTTTGPLLDQAIAAQGGETGVPEDLEDGDDEDDGTEEKTPAQVAASESAKARKARRKGGKS